MKERLKLALLAIGIGVVGIASWEILRVLSSIAKSLGDIAGKL